jgi:hypothetical protein
MKRFKQTREVVHLTGEELADYFDLSPGRISQLKALGVFDLEEDGLFDLTKSLVMYERFLAHPHLFRE